MLTPARLAAVAVIAVTTVTLVYVAAAPSSGLGRAFVPVNQVSQNSTTLWWTLGTNADAVEGPSERIGSTLLLGDANNLTPSEASWVVPSDEVANAVASGGSAELYLSASIIFASDVQPLTVTFGSQTYVYTPTGSSNVSWHEGTVYVPSPADSRTLPAPYNATFPSTYRFLGIPLSGPPVSQEAQLNLSLPAGGQIYVPVLAMVLTSVSHTNFLQDAVPLGAVISGFLLAGSVAVFFLDSDDERPGSGAEKP
jgi:hypothetical protein